jgi:GNAT superfamily N-acetyltransferase
MEAPTGRLAAEIRRPDPANPADLAALTCFFANLSLPTRYLRFFAPITPTPAMLRRLAGQGDAADALIAVIDGIIVGHAMAVDQALAVDQARAGSGPASELGVVVADAWQGRGVGSALMRALISRAQARGVTAVSMDVLPGNRRVLAMIASHWTMACFGRSADSTTVRVPLSPIPAMDSPRAMVAAAV